MCILFVCFALLWVYIRYTCYACREYHTHATIYIKENKERWVGEGGGVLNLYIENYPKKQVFTLQQLVAICL